MNKLHMIENIKSKINVDKVCKILLIVYIIIQPFLDNYMTLCDEHIQIAGTSLATIFRYLFMFILVVPIFIKNIKRKSTKILIGYLVICAVYSIFHLINAQKLDMNLLNDNSNYSAFGELFYITRMIMPMLLIYTIYILKPKYTDIKIIVTSVLTIIAIILLITNISGVAYVAYSVEDQKQIDSIFSWFGGENEPSLWQLYTCRGFCRSGNELSAISIMLLSIMMYIAFKEKNKAYWITVLLTMITFLMLSTRIAIIVGTLVFFGMAVLYIFMSIIKKDKFDKNNIIPFLVVAIIYIIMLYKSPFELRKETGELNFDDFNMMPVTEEKEYEKKEVFANDEEKIAYIKEYSEATGINAMFPNELYYAETDVDFYINLMNNVPYSEKYGNRNMKRIIMERLYERNNNPMDKWLGMSYLKITTCLYPERDFESHFYCIGILGIIVFVVPYFIIIGIGILNILKNFKDKFKIYNLLFIESALACLACGYFSGHVLDEIFVNTFLALVCGMILVNIKDNNEADELSQK